MAKELPPHVQRMCKELDELSERRKLLETFIHGNPTFGTLSVTDKGLLQVQLRAMITYESVLSMRVAAAQVAE